MELVYTVSTIDEAGNKHVHVFESTKEVKDAYEHIWDLDYDPNHLTDLHIHREIKK